MTQIVCVGHVNWDITLRVPQLPEPDGEVVVTERTEAGGGSAANVAVALAGLGHNAVLCGSVGDDDYGRRAVAGLTDAGVGCTHLQTVTAPTTVKRVVVDDQGRIMVLAGDGANEAFTADDLPAAVLTGADHLHVTGQDPATARRLTDRAATAGVSISVDPGRRIDRCGVGGVLDRADVVFCNDREATTAREADQLKHAEETKTTVVTQGPDGARLETAETMVSHPGFGSDVVDTTGAGDAFAAGYLSARFDGADREEALAIANACGALAVESVGARTTITSAAVDSRRRRSEAGG